MKTFVESYSKQLEQCIFPRMFIRNGPLSFEGGDEGTGKFPRNNRALQKHEEEKSCKWNHGEKHRTGASATASLIFYVKVMGLLQQTIAWYKIHHAGGQAHYYFRTGTLKQRDLNKSSVTGLCFNVTPRE